LGMKRLNNFVTELLRLGEEGLPASGRHPFVNPRDGWVFISSVVETGGSGKVKIFVEGRDGEDLVIAQDPTTQPAGEAMRHLSGGEYQVSVHCRGNAKLKRLSVRSVPEIIYCKFQYDPHVRECGPYDWEFLQRHILPNVNTIVGSGDPKHRPYIEEWKRLGGKWIIECVAPGLRAEEVSSDEAFEAWGDSVGLRDTDLDGIIVDEFGVGDERNQAKYVAWTEAVERVCRDERFKGKVFYPYCSSLYEGEASRRFIETVIRCGYRFAWERYLKEQPTEEAARDFLNKKLRDEALEWKRIIKGSERHMIVCLGYLSGPPESLDTNPSVDWKVYMDMQFHHLANDPAFEDIYGVMEYTSGYAEEEIIRWQGRLYRHYCIEGQKQRLSRDPYTLRHLVNPDFEEGDKGWRLEPAESGTMKIRRFKGYGWLQGRYPKTEEGDDFLWTRRSGKAPNVFSQEIKHLSSRRTYSLKMLTADYRDLVEGRSVEKRHMLSIDLEGAQILNRFQHQYQSCHDLGPFDGDNRFWMNYHFAVFRPLKGTIHLRVSDWATSDSPGGQVGEEIIYNFVQVQPYFEDEYGEPSERRAGGKLPSRG